MDSSIQAKLETGEFDTMYEATLDIMNKISGGTLHKSKNFETRFSPYMLCRFLSMRADLFPVAEYLSDMLSQGCLSNERFYKLAYVIVPKVNNDFLRYLKREKKEEQEEIVEAKTEVATGLFDL